MSSRCGCRFTGAADTLVGCHRDPISSEKCWLDFAVRELSRVAAGKGRGQEAVWRVQCRPAWWEQRCPGLAWKNPTANPKDSKDTLVRKFEALVGRLREEGTLPEELAEEVSLWEGGRVAEVFLMTTFSSMLGQVTSLHTMLDSAAAKMADTRVGVNPDIPRDIQRCLTACQAKINAIQALSVTGQAGTRGDRDNESVEGQRENVPQEAPRALKRSRHHTGNSSDVKRARVSPSPTTLPSPSTSTHSHPSSSSPAPEPRLSPSPTNSNLVAETCPTKDSLSNNSDRQAMILNLLQQKLRQNKADAVVEKVRSQQQQKAPRASSQSQAAVLRKAKHVAVIPSSSVTSSDLLTPTLPILEAPSPSLIPGDLFDIDLLEDTTIADSEFLDNLLAENTSLANDEVIGSELAPSHFSDLPNTDSVAKSPPSPHSNCTATSTPFPPVALSGCSWSLEDEMISLENSGTNTCTEGGGRNCVGVEEKEMSDSGYSSESSPSHRSSTDSFEDTFLVNSPDFDALLSSLEDY